MTLRISLFRACLRLGISEGQHRHALFSDETMLATGASGLQSIQPHVEKLEYISATCCHIPFGNDVIDLPQQGMHDHDGPCNQHRPLIKTLCLHGNKLSDTHAVQYIYSSCSPNWAIEYYHVHPAQEVKLLLELRYTHIKCARTSNKLRVNNGAYMFDSKLSWPGCC